MAKRVPDWEKIGPLLAAWLARQKAAGVTQQDVAARYHISVTQISNIKRGARRGAAMEPEVERFLKDVLPGGSIPYVEEPERALVEQKEPDLGPVGTAEKHQLANLDGRFPHALRLLRTVLSEGDEILRNAIINNLEGFARAAQEHVQLESLQRNQQPRRGHKKRR